MMSEDLKEFLRAFNEHGVKYLIVGGYAFGAHAEPRATKDLDVFIATDEANSNAVYRALAAYGAPLDGFTPLVIQASRLDSLLRVSTFSKTYPGSILTRPGKTALRA